MRTKFKVALLIEVLVVMSGLIFCASVSTTTAQSNYTINVAKTTQDDYTVSDGASYVGKYFNSTYTMTGTATDFIKAKDVLVASILDDFSKSPTIGYIQINNTVTQTNDNVTGLANPFASKDQVDEKVKSVLSYALNKIEHPVGITPNIDDSRQIKCVFGNVLEDFWCDIPTFVIR
jgi:hypothetical protein